MHELTELIRKDMVPALGVTEPGAIAFCAAKARTLIGGELIHLNVAMNSGMFKNAFTCGIPNSREVGNVFAAALGYAAGNPDMGLQSLSDVTPEDNAAAEKMVKEGKVSTSHSEIRSRTFIQCCLETSEGTAQVTIRDKHTNITKIVVNGETVLETEDEKQTAAAQAEPEKHTIHNYTLKEILDYVTAVPAEEIEFVKEAYRVNLELFEEGIRSERTTFAPKLLAMNGGRVISDNELRTAQLLCNAAIEARVIGLDRPAMSITGSGAHGIIATMPLYAVHKINHLSEEQLYRATMLSYLICTYIKEYSGRLSAFCGVHIDSVHGINGFTPEETMRNMGRIASPGMTMTEKTIVEIQQEKLHA